MKKIETFSRITGKNWINGRYLLPVLKTWGATETGTVLDLGCGESPFRIFFQYAEKYIRMDYQPSDDEVIKADMRQILLDDNSADCVLVFQALSDLPEPEICLNEIRRVLKPGGRLIVYESVCYPEHDMPYDYFRIMPAGLDYLALKVGFERKEVIRLGGGFNRFAMLWNTYLMGKLSMYSILKHLSVIGVIICNIMCYAADCLAPHTNLASDYIARFIKIPVNDM